MIHTAKRVILIILGSRKLTLDAFQTILAETELMLNSRPLTHVADYPENHEPLTPNHFILQRPYANLPPGVFKENAPLSLGTWKETQNLVNSIWRRLLKEYLPTLSKRQKWRTASQPLKVDDIVWVLKHLTPRGIWPLGRVTKTYPGRDGTVRVCTVQTA